MLHISFSFTLIFFYTVEENLCLSMHMSVGMTGLDIEDKTVF